MNEGLGELRVSQTLFYYGHYDAGDGRHHSNVENP